MSFSHRWLVLLLVGSGDFVSAKCTTATGCSVYETESQCDETWHCLWETNIASTSSLTVSSQSCNQYDRGNRRSCSGADDILSTPEKCNSYPDCQWEEDSGDGNDSSPTGTPPADASAAPPTEPECQPFFDEYYNDFGKFMPNCNCNPDSLFDQGFSAYCFEDCQRCHPDTGLCVKSSKSKQFYGDFNSWNIYFFYDKDDESLFGIQYYTTPDSSTCFFEIDTDRCTSCEVKDCNDGVGLLVDCSNLGYGDGIVDTCVSDPSTLPSPFDLLAIPEREVDSLQCGRSSSQDNSSSSAYLSRPTGVSRLLFLLSVLYLRRGILRVHN